MWNRLHRASVVQRFFRYSFWIGIVCRCIASFVLGYIYVVSTASQQTKKGWTFVEGIFSQVSYLPYLKSDDQSLFYQKLLFRSCLNANKTDESWIFEQDLCKVYTEDNQTYILKLVYEPLWSDWVKMKIEDVFFTYDEILRKNIRKIDSLNIRSQLNISLEDGKIKVVFPSATKDNQLFFTNSILPKHILSSSTLDDYRINFAINPISNACATILTQTKDENSLIFNLTKCSDTNFSYYQIKSYRDFEEMDNFLQWWKKSIVDVYESPYSLEWFDAKRVLTPYLMWIFFNTNSQKLTVRIRRSLWGLINAKFYTGDYQQYLQPYDGAFLNQFYSSGETIQDLISRINLDQDSTINELDLKESWAKELPNSITINWVDRKFIFFMQQPTDSRMLDINFNNAFDSIKIISPSGAVFTPKNYKPNDKKVSYKFTMNDNLKIWSNQYTIQWTLRGKTYTIASIDIYVFEHLTQQTTWDQQRKFNILYYSDFASVFVAQQLRALLKDAWILDNFIFEEVHNAEELEWKLLMWSFDLYISMIDLWSKKNIFSLFATENVLLNPSQYKNPILSSLIKQYSNNPTTAVVQQINSILSQDMPMVILGNIYSLLQMQTKLATEVFSGQTYLYSNQRRNQIYNNYSLVHNIDLEPSKIFNIQNFIDFIASKL